MRSWMVVGLLVVVQGMDVAVHVGVDQLEPIRVLSNAILVAGALLAPLAGARRNALLALGAAVYLLLNLGFLWDQGLVNPATDSLRVPLFGFVAVSLGLTAWLGRVGAAKN